MTKQSADEIELEKWLEIRKKAGRKIDPETAEIFWNWGEIGDPYGVCEGDPCGLYPGPGPFCIGRNFFARSLGSDIWVAFEDLTEATRDALWKKHKASLAFPAG